MRFLVDLQSNLQNFLQKNSIIVLQILGGAHGIRRHKKRI